MRAALALALALACLLAACAGDRSFVVVDVSGSGDPFDHLDVHVLNGGAGANLTIRKDAPIALPTSFSLSFAPDRAGEVQVDLAAVRPDGAMFTATGRIQINQHGTVHLPLVVGPAPSDGGAPDLAVSDGGGLPLAVFATGTAPQPSPVVVGDFDGNGILDVAMATCPQSGPGVFFLYGQSGAPTQIFGGPPGCFDALAVGDLDGTGPVDLAVGAASAAVYTLTGAVGTVKGPFTLPAAPVALAVGNFSGGNGRDVGAVAGSYVVVLPGDGAGNLGTPTTSDSFTTPLSRHMVAGRIAGALDSMIVFDPATCWVYVLQDRGVGYPGNLGPTNATPFAIGEVGGMAIADLDGNGQLDAVFAQDASCANAPGLATVIGGSPLLVGPSTQAPYQQPRALVTADLDKDGHADVVVADGTHLFVHLGRGDGTFDPPQLVSTAPYSASDLAAGDLDGDGYPDLVGVDQAGDAWFVVRNGPH